MNQSKYSYKINNRYDNFLKNGVAVLNSRQTYKSVVDITLEKPMFTKDTTTSSALPIKCDTTDIKRINTDNINQHLKQQPSIKRHIYYNDKPLRTHGNYVGKSVYNVKINCVIFSNNFKSGCVN